MMRDYSDRAAYLEEDKMGGPDEMLKAQRKLFAEPLFRLSGALLMVALATALTAYLLVDSSPNSHTRIRAEIALSVGPERQSLYSALVEIEPLPVEPAHEIIGRYESSTIQEELVRGLGLDDASAADVSVALASSFRAEITPRHILLIEFLSPSAEIGVALVEAIAAKQANLESPLLERTIADARERLRFYQIDREWLEGTLAEFVDQGVELRSDDRAVSNIEKAMNSSPMSLLILFRDARIAAQSELQRAILQSRHLRLVNVEHFAMAGVYRSLLLTLAMGLALTSMTCLAAGLLRRGTLA